MAMHLSYGVHKYKQKLYKSYSIAQSYRDNAGKVRKHILFPLGQLSDLQAEQIRFILKIAQGKEHLLSSLENIVPLKSVSYLDVAVANEIWENWNMNKAFNTDHITDSPVSTPLVAKIMTINRCIQPQSCYSIKKWVKKTALPQLLKIDPEFLNDDKLYYELDKIEKNKSSLESFLFENTYRLNPKSYDYVNYDLSTSYFVGIKCNLSQLGRSKDEKHHRRQVILAIMVNDEGYPFKWDVLPGNTAEVNTLEDNVEACRARFNLKDISLVFDRGIVSGDNLDMVNKRELKYISALDKNQIPNIKNVDLTVFKELTTENIEQKIYSLINFTKYDDLLYYQDLGKIDNKRYIVGINPKLFVEERKTRQEKLNLFQNFLAQLNKELQQAQRDRNLEMTKNRVSKELARLKLKRFFEKPTLTKIIVKQTLADKSIKKVRSYQISTETKPEEIAKLSLLDGVCCFITNHTETDKRYNRFLFSAKKIICGYRNKTQIEDAFKHIKSFLKIRPFWVNLDEHVKAIYTICVLAYFINRDLAKMRKKYEKIDFLNSRNLYEPFEPSKLIQFKDEKFGYTKSKFINPDPNELQIIHQLGFGHLVDKEKFQRTITPKN
jgi:transposase